MASLLRNRSALNYGDNISYLQGTGPAPGQEEEEYGPITIGGGTAPTGSAPAPSSAPAADTSLASGLSSTYTTPAAPQAVSFQKSGDLSSRLFDPLSTGVREGGESLSGAVTAFGEAAGPSRTYDTSGAQDILSGAYRTGEGMDEARDLLSATYAGPEGLDQGTVAGLQKLTADLRARRSALGSTGGLQTVIGQSVAGLTPGEAKFEARRLRGDEDYASQLQGFIPSIAQFASGLKSERQSAIDFARQRAGEEEAIGEKSFDYLKGEETDLSSTIQGLMDEKAAENLRAEQAFTGLMEGGDFTPEASQFLVGGVPGEETDLRGQAVAEQFNTQGAQDKAQADLLFSSIMNDPRYASVAGQDPLLQGVSKRGKAFWDVETPEGVKDIRQVVADPSQRSLLYDRQRELGKAFAGEGEFSTVKPLYGSQYGVEDYEAPGKENYLQFEPGIRPSRENASSQVQVDQFNRLNDLLGEMDEIGERQPFRAAKIFADAERYVDEEAATLEAKGEKLTKADKQWKSQVNKLRKRYRKKKRQAEYAKIGAVVGGVMGVGLLSPATAPAGYAAGRAMA